MLIIDDLLINLPVKGFFGIFKKIHETAEEELYNPEKIKETLTQLNEAYESGEIEKEEFEKLETKLLKRLEIGMERRKKEGGE